MKLKKKIICQLSATMEVLEETAIILKTYNETHYKNPKEKCVFCYKDYHSP